MPPTAGPQWTLLEAGEPLYGAPFDAAFDHVFSGVAYGDGFVLVGRTQDAEGRSRGSIWSTPDGAEWVRVGADDDVFDDADLRHVGTDGKRLVALGWQGPLGTDAESGKYQAWVSDDGVTWAVHDVEPTALGRDANGIVGSQSGFLAWGVLEDRHTRLLRSADGLAWESIDYPGSDDGNIQSVAPYGSGFVAVGARFADEVLIGAPSEPARAWWSPDGREWVATDVPGAFALVGVYPGAKAAFAVGARECSRCVDPYLTWGSPDGRTWQALGDLRGIHPIVASNGRQIAIFDWQGDRSISVSSDGLTWTKLAHVPAAEHDAGVIVGSTGVLLLVETSSTGADGVQDVHEGVLFLKGS